MKKRCRAENPECALERDAGSFQGSLKRMKCDVCCSEPGFCRECKCVLCGKNIRAFESELVFRCQQRISEAGVCGHAAHFACAISTKMAGVLKNRNIDMEYLCRRCDNKTDLKSLVTDMLVEIGRKNLRFCSQSSLHDVKVKGVPEAIVLKVLEKIQSGEGIQEVMKELSGNHHLDQTDEAFNEEASLDQWLPCVSSAPLQNRASAISQSSLNVSISPVTSLMSIDIADTNDFSGHVKKNLDKFPKQNASCQSSMGARDSVSPVVAENEEKQTDSLCNVAMENVWKQRGFENSRKSLPESVIAYDAPVVLDSDISNTNSHDIEGALPSQVIAGETPVALYSTRKDPFVSTFDSAPREPDAGRKTRGASNETSGDAIMQTVVEASSEERNATLLALGDPTHTPEPLDLQYDADIQDALEKLKERQTKEFTMKRDCLFTLKNEILNHHQELESAQHDLVTQATNMSLESLNALLRKISALSASMERQKMSFESLLLSCKR